MRILFLLISLVIISLHSRAQSHSAEPSYQCGTEEHHHHLMETDHAYKTRFLRQKAILDSVKWATPALDRQFRSVVTIPVVVHVIHLGERIGYQSNISDDQILGAIDGLNERFSNVNGQGIDIGINFCLANRDPNGCPSSGINRVDGSVVPGYSEDGISFHDECGVDEHAIKDLSKWSTLDYYNIWVVHDICGPIAGYAYYPAGHEYDGTVIDIVSMRYQNGTLAHELGHGLNLQHTFSGEEEDECPVDDDCLVEGDEVCDTPPHRRGDCSSFNPCSTEGLWLNSRDNWMSYCFPGAGAGLFTEGQRTRMQDAMVVEPRASLLFAQGCSNEEHMKITSDGSLMCPYDSRELTAQPAGGYFEIVSGSGYIDSNGLTPTGGTQIVLEYIIAQATCTSSVYQEIPVKTVPQSLLRSDEDTLCVGQTTELEGFPKGGIFSVVSGPGTLDSNLLIADGEGIIALAYEKLFSGCIVRDSHVVMSFDIPVVGIEPLSEDILTAIPDTGSYRWLRCDNGYELMTDETDAIFQVTSSGSYAVVTTSGICRDTSDCLVVVLTATRDDNMHDAIRLYPNPVKDIFYVDGYPQYDEVEVTLTDMRGVTMTPGFYREASRMKIDIAGFPSGVYVMRVYVRGVGYVLERVVKV